MPFKKGKLNPSFKHGFKGTRLYKCWEDMKRRCNAPNTQSYRYYDALGISVCAEWQASFIPFKEWALDNGYEDNLSLDRLDNDGNYNAGNCRWATPLQQVLNRGHKKVR